MEDQVLLRPSENRFQDLRLCFCGYEVCDPLHGWGPAVRPNYLIHFVLSGKGNFQVHDRRWELSAGEGFLIEPEVVTYYQADQEDPWTYVWIGFEGRLAAPLVHLLGLGNERLIFRSKHGAELRQVVLAMLRSSTLSLENDFLLQSQLHLFFAILLRDLDVHYEVTGGGENLYVRAARNYIQANYSRNIHVSDIAAYTGINRSYLYTLFRKELGISPQKYLANYRLSRAAELLTIKDYSVETIAISCGYSDPLVFSKAFKQTYGMPPLRYREKNQHAISEKKIQDQDRPKRLPE